MIENVPLVDLLGAQNVNIKTIAKHFPKSKIISRGNEILVKGNESEIKEIFTILDSLILHLEKSGKITEQRLENIIENGHEPIHDKKVVYGSNGKVIKPRTPNQAELVETIEKNDLVFALGPAGTGKTFVSVAMAVKALKNKEVKKIIITRPAVEAGENLGFLPGDLKEKIDPYLRPIYDALDDMIPAEKLKYYQEYGIIEIAPLAYMRGRTLNNAYVILDEAQNTTTMQIKMFLTRMGPNSKMIITGDVSQIDLPKHQKSGLKEAINTLKGINGIGFVKLTAKDVVRHKLVKDIVNAYDRESLKKDKKRKED